LAGKASTTVGWLIYDDESLSAASCSATNCGHTKGVIGFDAKGAFWLIHSVPKYPPPVSTSSYSYPPTGVDYGQSFLCTTLPFSALAAVATQLLYTAPGLVDSHMPASLASSLSGLNQVITGIKTSYIKTPTTSVHVFTTVGGVSFTHFAKTAKWGQDLYGALVAKQYQDSVYVESWMRPAEASVCPVPTSNPPVYGVINVLNVTLGGITFGEPDDHSKWAIGVAKNFVCIGDINHQLSQSTRSGGTMCTSSVSLWNTFHGFVTATDQCPPGGKATAAAPAKPVTRPQSAPVASKAVAGKAVASASKPVASKPVKHKFRQVILQP